MNLSRRGFFAGIAAVAVGAPAAAKVAESWDAPAAAKPAELLGPSHIFRADTNVCVNCGRTVQDITEHRVACSPSSINNAIRSQMRKAAAIYRRGVRAV